MKLATDLTDWIMNHEEFGNRDLANQYKLNPEITADILAELTANGFIAETMEDNYILTEKTLILKNLAKSQINTILEPILINVTHKTQPGVSTLFTWESLNDYVTRIIKYEGDPTIYEIIFKNKEKDLIIRLENKEIMDYKMFVLRFYEKTGTMLPAHKGINQDWANMVSFWTHKYGETIEEQTEFLSPTMEAKEMVIDYIENAVLVDNLIIREGAITFKNDKLFVSTKVINRMIKRNNLNVSMRSLSFELKDYLLRASTPYKVGNKSERFWIFNHKKFDIDTTKVLKGENDYEA